MSKCGYDNIFYRVFCATLLAIALAFTVILANVFVDIDSILVGKEKGDNEPPAVTTAAPQYQVTVDNVNKQSENKQNDVIYLNGASDVKDNNEVYQPEPEDNQEQSELKERDDNYRTKRSINTPNNVRLDNSKIKEILNNRLSMLLEELDVQESRVDKSDDQKRLDAKKSLEFTDNIQNSEVNKSDSKALHEALHNVLIRGIIDHSDINKVYNNVHNVVNTYEKENEDIFTKKNMEYEKKVRSLTLNYRNLAEIGQAFSIAEEQLLKELTKCTELQKEIESTLRGLDESKILNSRTPPPVKAPKISINTLIDIKTRNKQNHSKVQAKSIKGFIKVIYNGKPINFSRMEDNEVQNTNTEIVNKLEQEDDPKTKINDVPKPLGELLNIVKFLTKNPLSEDTLKNSRPKRSSKTNNQVSGSTTETPKKNKKKPGKLYVEIETHFDGHGIKGDKKRKLVKAIIDKIRKALQINVNTTQTGSRSNNHSNLSNIKKRVQNPLKEASFIIPLDQMIIRNSEPISKSIKPMDPLPEVYDDMGEIWHKAYSGSHFLSNVKAINSGEMGMINLDYDRVLKDNGIPQRLQQPLNSDNADEFADDSNYYNLGDLKFYVKEIDGTGFSIGFNQFVGDAPDPEVIKHFTGQHQLVNVYNQDEDGRIDINSQTRDKSADEHEISKRDTNKVSKLSNILKELPISDSVPKEYNVVFDENHMPYDTYSEIFEDGSKRVSFSLQKVDKKPNESNKRDIYKEYEIYNFPEIMKRQKSPFYIDENLFNKDLKLSEAIGIASFTKRKKRSPLTKLTKYTSSSNSKSKSTLKKIIHLNTKRKFINQKIKNKRNKREVEKIRIIATDDRPQISRKSNENFFVVSDENMFANRATLREVEPTEPDENQAYLQHMTKYLSPYNIFATRSRYDSLMSKYPHLFVEENTRSKEEVDSIYSKILDSYPSILDKNDERASNSHNLPHIHEFESSPSDNNYDGNEPNPNYKLIVKITPKIQNDTSGIKTVHTSINKTINRNGLLYLSQLNVSEISKVERVNKHNGQNSFKIASKINPPEDPKNQLDIQSLVKKIPESNVVVNSTQKLLMESGTFLLMKHIKEQQERMKILLKQHKQRIDEQLEKLKQEKNNIDTIILRGLTDSTTPADVKPETIDIVLPLNPPQKLHLNKDEAEQLIANALMKLHDTPLLNDLTEKKIQNSTPIAPLRRQGSATTNATTTTTTTTTAPPSSTSMNPIDPDKLLSAMQRNENLTNKILFKIDRNTNLMQHFLQKITERLEASKPDIGKPRRSNFDKTPAKEHHTFLQPMTKMEVNKNVSSAVPFVYTYQQPYQLLPPNNKHPGNLLYHAPPVHTNIFNNGYQNIDKNNKVIPDRKDMNNSRFFPDDLKLFN